MNLKESFRYQNYLNGLMSFACSRIQNGEYALATTKVHNKSKSNPDATDMVENVEIESSFPNDEVIRFMRWLIEEREKLTKAIGIAKANAGFDVDAAVETNKFRQAAKAAVNHMLSFAPSKKVERGQDYKFNAEGNQMPYYYEIEVTKTEAYDKDASKAFVRAVASESDKASADIDSVMINSVVDYEPRFDVNETFDDVMTEFMKK